MDNNSNYTKKEGQGTLFKNDRKQSDNHPDYTGSIMIGGVEKRIAGWVKTSRGGVRYLSVSISDFQQRQEPDAVNYREQQAQKPTLKEVLEQPAPQPAAFNPFEPQPGDLPF